MSNILEEVNKLLGKGAIELVPRCGPEDLNLLAVS
jgi:hypothetical protein